MPFSFRKSFGLKGFRVNFSKSGVGVSAGVKGFRVSSGPRGTWVTVGAGGVYYRQKISVSSARRSSTTSRGATPPPGQSSTVDAPDLIPINPAEALSQLNETIRTRGFALIPGICTIIGFLLCLTSSPGGAFLVLLIGSIGTALIHALDSNRKFELHYHVDDSLAAPYVDLARAIADLGSSAYIWLTGEESAAYYKTNAGATSNVSRVRGEVRMGQPRNIKSNIDVPMIQFGSESLSFFPDGLYVCKGSTFYVIRYQDIHVGASSTPFVESFCPGDSRVIGNTWQYVNKDGSPDLRYKYNPQYYVVEYSVMLLRGGTFKAQLMLSNRSAAAYAAQRLNGNALWNGTVGTTKAPPKYGKSDHGHNPGATGNSSQSRQSQWSQHSQGSQNKGPATSSYGNDVSWYQVLGIDPTCTNEQLRAAFRKKIAENHPDLVARLDPEFQRLAQQRTQAILAAYDQARRERNITS
ncbi:MAG TPA: DUF4236 domain-containing protein [Fimbriimonadaceae bacterium]|nr:DUF4236 domain-containing protein [Fimbriimonadaceae bacterium]